MMSTTARVQAGSNAPSNEETDLLKEENLIQLMTTEPSAQNLAGNGFTYRHDWGNRRGSWKLTLNWGAISNQSRIFVSICEFGGGSNQGFVGAAKYTVHNVAPFDGGVTIWINIDWSADIRVRADYLIVNP